MSNTVPTEKTGSMRPVQPNHLIGSHPYRGRLFLERYLLVFVWAAVVVFFAATRPESFLQPGAFHAVFGSSAIYVFLGLSGLVTIVAAEIDLSVAFVMGISATTTAVAASAGVNVWLAALLAVLVGLVCGVLNAVIVVSVGVHSLIATLGSGTVYLGIANAISHEIPVGGIPSSFSQVATYDLFGLPLTFWYGLLLAVFLTYFLAFTPLGRHMMFVGSNREVARLAGIQVERIRFGAYTAGGLIAGIAGALLAAQLGGFDASASQSYLLPTFAIMFLSAAVVRPGRFNPIGVMIAAYFIATGTLGLQLFGFTGWTQQVFYGGSLVVAIAVVTLVRRQAIIA